MSEIGLGKTWDAMEAFDPLSEALNKADHLTFATSLKGFTETAFCPERTMAGSFWQRFIRWFYRSQRCTRLWFTHYSKSKRSSRKQLLFVVYIIRRSCHCRAIPR